MAEDTNDPQLKDLHEVLWSLRPVTSKLMGYPVHSRTVESTSPGPDWINVLTLGSHEETGWSWCDGAHLDIYVPARSVADRTFSPARGDAA